MNMERENEEDSIKESGGTYEGAEEKDSNRLEIDKSLEEASPKKFAF